jgi:dienelactone hydrolase
MVASACVLGSRILKNLAEDGSARVEPFGWVQWPENDDFSEQLMRVMSSAQEGGSTVSECLGAATRIDPRDDESWYREWKKVADDNRKRGNKAFGDGHTRTAQGNWLRATNYYRTALRFLAAGDLRKAGVVEQMQRCGRNYVGNLTRPGEAVEIPWSGDHVLQGYFLPAAGPVHRAPVVICVGGTDYFKEEHLLGMPGYAHDRAMALLLVDLPGQGYGQSDRRLGGRGIEWAISSCVDFLIARDDIDQRRIAIFGLGVGASFATRAAALDQRFAAAVCDGGIWDLQERAFAIGRFGAGARSLSVGAMIKQYSADSIARRIKCPILVAQGQHDWLDAGDVAKFCNALKEQGVAIHSKRFAASPADIDNPALGQEDIFDWISNRLDDAGTTASSDDRPAQLTPASNVSRMDFGSRLNRRRPASKWPSPGAS